MNSPRPIPELWGCVAVLSSLPTSPGVWACCVRTCRLSPESRCSCTFNHTHKIDTTAKGNSIQLAWLTQSGVPLGDMTRAYMSLLTQDVLPWDFPFFVPTSRLEVFTAVAPGSVRFISGYLYGFCVYEIIIVDWLTSSVAWHRTFGDDMFCALHTKMLNLWLQKSMWPTCSRAQSSEHLLNTIL